MVKIVLTGGGHGGKSRFAAEAQASLRRRMECITIPELADTAFSCGMNPESKAFERFVYSIQKATEDAACHYTADGITLCHRGTLDSLAFWIRKGWIEREFFAQLNTSLEIEYSRYAGIIHLETTALGAEEVYLHQVASRPIEPLEKARELDELCARVWRNHPYYARIANKSKEWDAKSSEALQALERILAASRNESGTR